MNAEAIRDLFAGLGAVRTRPMFGGLGVYRGETIFAIAVGGELYLKVDVQNRPAFVAAGSRPFTYLRADGRSATMSYWRLPDPALDDPEEASRWGRSALDAAERSGRSRKRD